MAFTRQDTNIGKGIAISLMIIHHLFNSKMRILDGNSYIPFLVYVDIEPYIAGFGKICVASFLFLSGYGLYLGFHKSNKKIIAYMGNKIMKFYAVFWAQFVIFIPIGYLFFTDVTIINQETLRYVSDWKVILTSFMGLSNRFNGAWWFVTLYIELLFLVFPLYIYLMHKNINIFLLINMLLLLVNYNLDAVNKLLFWQTSFAVGMYCAKYNIFSSPVIRKVDTFGAMRLSFIVGTCVVLRFALGMFLDFILAPVFIYTSIKLVKCCKVDSILEYIGRYSFPMWLNHNFFALYFFQDIMYYPKYSPLIVIFVLISSLLSSVLIERVRCGVFSVFQKTEKKKEPDAIIM